MEQTEDDLIKVVESLFKIKKYDEIVILLTDIALDNLNSAPLYAFKARALGRLGKIDLCLSFAKKAILIDPSLASGYLARGNAMFHIKNFDDALDDYNKAIGLDSGDSYSYYNRALIWINNKQYDKALEDCNISILINEDNAAAYLTRANIWYNQKEIDNALQDYNKAIELDENYALGYYSRALFWSNQKNFINALTDYNKAIELDEKYISAYLNRANIWAQQKEYEKAIYDYNKIIQIEKNNPAAYLGRGNVFYSQKKFDRAINDFDKTIELDPINAHAYNNRGNAWYNQNEFKSAIKDYDEAIKVDEKYFHAYYNRALSYEQIGLHQKAIDDYNKYLTFGNIDDDYFSKIALSKIENLKKNIRNKDYEEIDKLIKEIKQLLLYDKPFVTHYTSLTAATAMILKASPFRLSEGAFLNDTSEGRELFNFLSFSNPIFDEKETVGENFIEKPFIGSFVADSKHNDLTLWRMYGKENQAEAKGCALTISKEYFVNDLETNLSLRYNIEGNIPKTTGDFTFYRVAYRKLNKFIIPERHDKVNRRFNTLLQKLKVKIYNVDKNQLIDISKLLNEIAYLFKTAEYQYENEIRLVVPGIGFKKKFEKEMVPPKVYIELIDILPALRTITLGPKVERADEWAACFNYYIKENNEKDMPFSFTKDEKFKIIISRLPFK